jgi:hypothetical protein
VIADDLRQVRIDVCDLRQTLRREQGRRRRRCPLDHLGNPEPAAPPFDAPGFDLRQSSTLLINAVSRSPSLTMDVDVRAHLIDRAPRSAIVALHLGKMTSSRRFLIILAKPRTDVSGVRSS